MPSQVPAGCLYVDYEGEWVIQGRATEEIMMQVSRTAQLPSHALSSPGCRPIFLHDLFNAVLDEGLPPDVSLCK